MDDKAFDMLCDSVRDLTNEIKSLSEKVAQHAMWIGISRWALGIIISSIIGVFFFLIRHHFIN